MNNHSRRRRLFFYLGVLATITVSTAQAFEAEPEVRIRLRATTEVPQTVVLLEQIADVHGGNIQLRHRIAALDITDPPAESQRTVVSRDQIAIRLTLAGIRDTTYLLEGAPQAELLAKSSARVVKREASRVHESGDGPWLTNEKILSPVRKLLAKRLQERSEDLDVRLKRPLLWTPTVPDGVTNIGVEPRLPESVQPGPLRVELAINFDGRLAHVLPAFLDVKVFQQVPKVTQQIDVGDIFTNQNISSERVPVDGRLQRTVAVDLLGKRSRRTMNPGDIVRKFDVREPQEAKEQIVVQRRDQVQLVARKGALTVTVSAAEALQSGKIGDTIRVRNMRSKKTITGRVVSRSKVEVDL